MKLNLDIAAFIPASLVAYRNLIADAFSHFLERLPAHRHAEILDTQSTLPTSADAEQRFAAVLRCCPTLHKLGQVLARDKRLAAPLRRELQRLEVLEGHTPLATIRPIVENELGDTLKSFDIRLAPHALAEGSVAVAWPATWTDPNARETQHRAVLKVPRPGIRDRVAEDIAAMRDVAEFLEDNADRYNLPALDCREVIDDICRLLEGEIDFRREQTHLATAASQCADDPAIVIPALTPFCTNNITAMTHLDGVKVTALAGASSSDRDRIASRIATRMLANVLFADDDEMLFHGDPHAGNLLHTHDDRLGLLDWSLADSLNKSQRGSLARLTIAAMTWDAAAIARELASLARQTPDERTLRTVAEASLADLNLGTLPGISWLTRLLDRAAIAGVQFPENALLFRKALHTLIGVITDIAPEIDLDRQVWSQGMSAFMHDLPTRGLTGPTADTYRIRLSNADLLQTWLNLPMAPLRYWQQTLSRLYGPRD